MRADVPPFEVLRHTFWLGQNAAETDPPMRRMAECVAEIRPAIVQLSETYGDRRVMWALAAIIIEMGIDADDGEMVAAIFRTNARLLELGCGADLLG